MSVNYNIRDCTDLFHLVILNNLQNINSRLIAEKISQSERLIMLNDIAKKQMKILENSKSVKELELFEKELRNNLKIDK